MSLGIARDLVNSLNKKGFSPMIELAMKGFQEEHDEDKALDNRAAIIEKLLEAGADPNYCKEATKMTAMHWLAYRNDGKAIDVLLRKGGDAFALSHDNNLPIDVAGTTPSWDSLRVLLNHYQVLNHINALDEYQSRNSVFNRKLEELKAIADIDFDDEV